MNSADTIPDNSLRRSADASLVRQARDGNETAALRIYERYAERMLALARAKASPALAQREAPEDIVQSAFGSFFRGLSKGGYHVPHGRDLWSLLVVITLNKVRAKGAFHRAAKRDVRATVGEEQLRHATGPDSASDLELLVEEAMSRLPEHARRMIVMRIQGHDLAAIAEATDRSYRTVERVLHGFRELLGTMLAEESRRSPEMVDAESREAEASTR